MARSMTFTTRALEALRPGATPYEVRESGGEDADGHALRGTGLRLRVSPTGIKTFRWPCTTMRRVFTLGTLGDGTGGTITLSDARKRLAELKVKVAAGVDPDATVDGSKRPRTVEDLCRVFYEESIKLRRKRPEEALAVLEQKIIPVIGRLPLVAVDTMQARRPVVEVVKAGYLVRAGAVLQVLKQLFRFAAANGYMDRNPAEPLRADDLGVARNQKRRDLSAEEIAAVWRALDASTMEPAVRLGLKLLFLTGLRTLEALTLEWRDVDLEAATVTVRVENQKLTLKAARHALPYVVPLSNQAKALVEELRALCPAGKPWVFWSSLAEDGQGGHLGDKALARAFRRLWEERPGKGKRTDLREAEGRALLTIPPASPHNFRDTLATHMSDTLGLPPHVGQLCLGHSLNRLLGSGVSAKYDHAKRLDERRKALQAYADWVDNIVTGEGAEVVPMPRAGNG